MKGAPGTEAAIFIAQERDRAIFAFLGLFPAAGAAALQQHLGHADMRDRSLIGRGGEGLPELLQQAVFQIASIVVHLDGIRLLGGGMMRPEAPPESEG